MGRSETQAASFERMQDTNDVNPDNLPESLIKKIQRIYLRDRIQSLLVRSNGVAILIDITLANRKHGNALQVHPPGPGENARIDRNIEITRREYETILSVLEVKKRLP